MDDLRSKPESYWRERLTPEQFEVCRKGGTECAFTGRFYAEKGEGRYACACCETELFDSGAKFESGTGWPSYFQPIASDLVEARADLSHGMRREEVLCRRCGAHLGHVFDDGPRPTGKRYCINSAALKFLPRPR